jgi:hypothetical protein
MTPDPKALRILSHVGHNDLIAEAGDEWAAAVAAVAGGTRHGLARWR